MARTFSRHAAFARLTLHAVAAFEGCVQAGDGFGHALKMRRRSAEREQMLATQALIVQHRRGRDLQVLSSHGHLTRRSNLHAPRNDPVLSV